MKVNVILHPDPTMGYTGVYNNRTIELLPAFMENGWYASFDFLSGERKFLIEPCFPIRLSMTLEEEGYDLRYTEWSEKPSKKYGYNPFKKFDRLEHWSTISSSVYFVENSLNGLIKIGYSGNYPTRMAQLNNQYKAKLKILGLMDGGLSEEKSIHKLFSENQVEGEWFSGCQAIRDFIIEYCYLPIISVPTGQ